MELFKKYLLTGGLPDAVNSYIKDKNIIGIFDLDNTTVMKKTIDYLNNAEKEKSVII